jgi:putative flippase GtrA
MKYGLNIRIKFSSLLQIIFSKRFLKFGTVGASGTLVNLSLWKIIYPTLYAIIRDMTVRQ